MRGLLAYTLPAACGCHSLRKPDRGLAQRVVPTHRAIWARPLASTGLVLICGRQRAQDAGSAGAHAPNSLWSSFAAQAHRLLERHAPPALTCAVRETLPQGTPGLYTEATTVVQRTKEQHELWLSWTKRTSNAGSTR